MGLFWTRRGAISDSNAGLFWGNGGAIKIPGGASVTYVNVGGSMSIVLFVAVSAQKVLNGSGATSAGVTISAGAQRVANASAACNVGLAAAVAVQRVQNAGGAVLVGLSIATTPQKILNAGGALNLSLTIAATASLDGGGQVETPSTINYYATTNSGAKSASTWTASTARPVEQPSTSKAA